MFDGQVRKVKQVLVRLTLFALFSINCLSAFGQSEGPYCGVYAVYAASVILDSPSAVSLEQLITEEFISQPEGSTTSDIIEAARKMGLKAIPYRNSSLFTLITFDRPLILHVSSPGQLRFRNHWVLCLGVEDGHAILLDGSDSVKRREPLSKLLLKWDGLAIGLYPETDNATTEIWQASSELIFYMAISALSAMTLAIAYSLFTGFGSWVNFVATSLMKLMLVVLIVICGVNFFGISSSASLRLLELENKQVEFESVELVGLLSPESYAIVDARYNSGFSIEHYPGAISVPVDCTDSHIARIAEQLKEKKVLVYCESASCEFDEIVANRLAREGVENLFVCKDGFRVWLEFSRGQNER